MTCWDLIMSQDIPSAYSGSNIVYITLILKVNSQRYWWLVKDFRGHESSSIIVAKLSNRFISNTEDSCNQRAAVIILICLWERLLKHCYSSSQFANRKKWHWIRDMKKYKSN